MELLDACSLADARCVSRDLVLKALHLALVLWVSSGNLGFDFLDSLIRLVKIGIVGDLFASFACLGRLLLINLSLAL